MADYAFSYRENPPVGPDGLAAMTRDRGSGTGAGATAAVRTAAAGLVRSERTDCNGSHYHVPETEEDDLVGRDRVAAALPGQFRPLLVREGRSRLKNARVTRVEKVARVSAGQSDRHEAHDGPCGEANDQCTSNQQSPTH